MGSLSEKTARRGLKRFLDLAEFRAERGQIREIGQKFFSALSTLRGEKTTPSNRPLFRGTVLARAHADYSHMHSLLLAGPPTCPQSRKPPFWAALPILGGSSN